MVCCRALCNTVFKFYYPEFDPELSLSHSAWRERFLRNTLLEKLSKMFSFCDSHKVFYINVIVFTLVAENVKCISLFNGQSMAFLFYCPHNPLWTVGR